FARQKQEASPDSDLTGLLSSILEILEITTPDEVKILWVPPSEEILFDINPTRLQQLVMNLCINAVHAMPEGGELRISLSMNKEKEILLEISDTGSGIKKESLDKIFDALYTTKEEGKGTGLGLFVVKQIVDEHNGKIAVHSEPGKGSTFSITFTCR
ncbi:MAG: ATP-binding protein, partial [bacterium]|nr:ATP-binding protein [bacterium]